MKFRKLIDILSSALSSRRGAKTIKQREKESELKQFAGNLRAMLADRRKQNEAEEEYDDVELTGRGAKNDQDEWNQIQTKRRLVESSNVYAYHYIPESATSGIMYVTFLNWEKGMKPEERSGPGQTYAYYNVPVTKYQQFESAATESAGRAVWDYFRVRGSAYEHQHPYTLVQAEGDYVSRKATAKGYAARTLLAPGSPRVKKFGAKAAREFREDQTRKMEAEDMGRALGRRSTLAPEMRGKPNRAEPNRGTPNRGNR